MSWPARFFATLFPNLGLRGVRLVALVWFFWTCTVLTLSAAAMTLPTTTENSWTRMFHAPPLARWDSVWYRQIAAEGYSLPPPQEGGTVGFYPLYPLLVGWVSALTGIPILSAGIALSIASLLPALIIVAELFAEQADSTTALYGLLALLAFPTSFHFAAMYTESLFLLGSVAAVWGARRRWWAAACLGGAVAALTRFNGFLILVPLIAYAWRSWRSEQGLGERRRSGFAIAVTALAAALFPTYLWWRWGDPLLYVHDKAQGWANKPRPFWELVGNVCNEVLLHLREPGIGGKLDLLAKIACAGLFVLLTVELFRRRYVPEGLYLAATLLLLFHGGTLDGIPRYVLCLFLGFLVLGDWARRSPALGMGYFFFSWGLGIVYIHRFVHWIIVA